LPPQTQGEVERSHQSLKTCTLEENDFLPDDLEAQVDAFAGRYNHQHNHESLKNLTPAASTPDTAKPFCSKGRRSKERR
jgi:putative transposase